MIRSTRVIFWLLLLPGVVLASEDGGKTKGRVETISIYGDPDSLPEVPSSAFKLDEEQLKIEKTGDIHQILKQVPGVYVQEEDGVGLRPNIGFRGAHPHRSKKVTLMEDRVLMAPAPYSAPAAYYFPVMDGISSVEVFKGASSSKYGPNSIGGALNLVSREGLLENRGEVDLSYGSYGSRKIYGAWGGHKKSYSYLLHGTYFGSEGFKELESNKSTGFEKGNIGGKLRFYLPGDADQVLDLRAQVTVEDSNETYLGLTSDDFSQNGLERYAASQDDQMKSQHELLQVRFTRETLIDSQISVVAYQHRFARAWSKVQGFVGGKEIGQVIANPKGGNQSYFLVLTGQEDTSSDQDELVYGHNDRTYLSQGLQSDVRLPLPGLSLDEHRLDVGGRVHMDSVVRNHTFDQLKMMEGHLVPTSVMGQVDANGQNKDISRSQSLYLNHVLEVDGWEFSTGARYDQVQSRREQLLTGDVQENEEVLVTPGAAVSYRWSDHQLFAGVHRGLNLVGPGQEESIQPEESINSELGYRYRVKRNYFEAVAFQSLYSNLVGVCSFSTGCDNGDIGKKFNGGEARIYGLEVAAGRESYWQGIKFPVRWAMTLTDAHFASRFQSDNKEWGQGIVEKGDPLPYVPSFQSTVTLGAQYKNWLLQTAIKYQGDVADQAIDENRKTVPGFGTIDLLGEYKWNKDATVYLKADNIFDHRYVVSYRPLGARPGKPLTLTAGTRLTF